MVLFWNALAKFLKDRKYLTISFDGWSSRAKDEIYTFHTTLPSRRSIFTTGHVFNGISVTAAELLKVVKIHIFNKYGARSYSAVVGDGGSNVRAARKLITKEFPWILNVYDPCHNLNLFLKDLGKLFKEELKVVSAASNFFGQSNLGTAQLTEERKRMNIGTGMKSASETRFGTTYHQANAVQKCMPALVNCVTNGTITFTTKAAKWLTPYFKEGPRNFTFRTQLDRMTKLFESGANGITTLEGQNVTCADVFYVWVTIAWHLERVLSDLENDLSQYRSDVIHVYNERFSQMMTETSHELFLLGYVLHPCTST
ncbi:ribonuclease H-like domain-containing protein [Lentinula boryana]|uniref:Ribonuclease H-like domain-containing protein n=1 Tax=Lentinula boryana TaxID=40481 RepID=A0ABQ8PWV1_9AGAR|nr:ribonuclease H-like domain-containing protein [Lentinula boryana]